MTPAECLEKGAEAERLAADFSTLPERRALLEVSKHWRLLAVSVDETGDILRRSPRGFASYRFPDSSDITALPEQLSKRKKMAEAFKLGGIVQFRRSPKCGRIVIAQVIAFIPSRVKGAVLFLVTRDESGYERKVRPGNCTLIYQGASLHTEAPLAEER